ncbi:hypothetical protein G7043_41230 [Lentzea sp. NEAU-D13]|uniref:Conserved hypothetical protein CHP02391 domain-containing protein n=1 Tax=Lentzea alba TaxID=2714351 RepID=A0A7C9W5U5_9PSEU|nr:TIGR02391 family protein [Lentzea alba]NGY65337.1 hypothetical protein [Lentzea alba]
MDLELAHEKLGEVLKLIDDYGDLYERRWGYGRHQENDGVTGPLSELVDKVRARARLAQDVTFAMGEPDIANKIVEHEEGAYLGHSFQRARLAIIEAIAILAQREELAAIVGPTGPRLSAAELNPTIWGAAAALWDGGHHRAAVQTAATALEGLLQAIAGPGVSGEKLSGLFSTTDPTAGSPRLRFPDVDSTSMTWRSAHEGAVALVRGSFMAVRNLVSHPGWPDPAPHEALEMLAVLSHVANLVQRATIAKAP